MTDSQGRQVPVELVKPIDQLYSCSKETMGAMRRRDLNILEEAHGWIEKTKANGGFPRSSDTGPGGSNPSPVVEER
jgi:hypothetical protein